MDETAALSIIASIIKDRKQWGESAGIRVAQWELVNALLAVEHRLLGEFVSKDDLTVANRRYAALNAQHELLKKRFEESKTRKEGTTNGNARSGDKLGGS